MNKSVAAAGPSTESQTSVLFRVLATAHELEARLEAELDKLGLSLAKAGVLDVLGKARDPLTLGELALKNSCVRSNITQLVDRLEADGLVRRVNDPDDRRVRRAALTTLGRKRSEQASAVIASEERAVAQSLTRDDTALLAKILGQLKG